MARRSQAALQGARFPVIVLLRQTNTRFALRNALNFRSSLITRTVIHYDDFDFPLVVRSEQRAQSFRDHFLFVVSSYHHADRLREIYFRSAPKTIREPD